MKRRRTRKGGTNNRLLPAGNTARENFEASIKTGLPDFDFSKRSHQAAFWMLLNTIVFEREAPLSLDK